MYPFPTANGKPATEGSRRGTGGGPGRLFRGGPPVHTPRTQRSSELSPNNSDEDVVEREAHLREQELEASDSDARSPAHARANTHARANAHAHTRSPIESDDTRTRALTRAHVREHAYTNPRTQRESDDSDALPAPSPLGSPPPSLLNFSLHDNGALGDGRHSSYMYIYT